MALLGPTQPDSLFFGFALAKVVDGAWSFFYYYFGSKLAEPTTEGGVKTLQTTDWSGRIITSATQDILHKPTILSSQASVNVATIRSSYWLAVGLGGGLYLGARPMIVREGVVKSSRGII